jgi:putative mRNA 3-end processing factor
MALHPDQWLKPAGSGLYCEPGGFHIDPGHPVDRAIVTHGHGDHARPGHRRVLATPGTLAIMRSRYGEDCADVMQALEYGERVKQGEVTVWLAPAGHVLGSAQVVLEHGGSRAVISGDYKRRFDPTCTPFQVVQCDVFITEATFGLPVFIHPPDSEEIGKLLHSLELFPESSHVVGVYALGKCQRVIALLRRAGYDAPLYLHGALIELCDLYRTQGIDLGELRPATTAGESLAGKIVLAPPSALEDRWSRRLVEPVTAMASGWMRVRARARQRGAELPLIISDHADWPELTRTLTDVGASEIWVTHGREEALMHYATQQGLRARALALIGREEEAQ